MIELLLNYGERVQSGRTMKASPPKPTEAVVTVQVITFSVLDAGRRSSTPPLTAVIRHTSAPELRPVV